MRRALESQATPDERHAHGAGDYSPVVIRPRRSAASGYLSPDRACASREVADLERAGIAMIQMDEPAIREGLPLRSQDWKTYLRGAVDAFKLATSGVQDETQIHTHMCYSEFGDILEAIAELDADVISIETSRSKMELLADFARFRYPNAIGPGVYDVHSPRVPTKQEMANLLLRAEEVLFTEQLWVNPNDDSRRADGPKWRRHWSTWLRRQNRLDTMLGGMTS